MTIDEEAFSVMTNRAVRRGYMRLDDLRDFVEAYEQAKKPVVGASNEDLLAIRMAWD